MKKFRVGFVSMLVGVFALTTIFSVPVFAKPAISASGFQY
jgi:hypothetical protein